MDKYEELRDIATAITRQFGEETNLGGEIMDWISEQEMADFLDESRRSI